MEKTITIEGISYTFRTRTVKEGKELRNKFKVGISNPGNEIPMGDLQILTILSSLREWSRPEPLTRENFENLTPDTHLDKLFEVAQEVNTLTDEEKKG